MKRILLIALLLAAALHTFAEDSIGWHVVKAGETLSGITAKYLGSSADWRDNWKLNPDIKDPNHLKPGQRIRIILSRTLPARSALVNRVARRVERKPEPDPWTAAHAGDRLGERNGIRTYEASSAELKFEDNTVLTLTERSLVFLRGTKTAAQNRSTDEIEIVDGHADLDKPAPSASRSTRDIEIVVGTTTAKPASGEAKARFRKEGTAAQVMSYRGGTNVASGGATVKVGEGMGVAVPEGKKPPKPERLLVAPALAAVDVAAPRPTLRWSAVDGASAYSAEVCRDASCAEIVAREASLATTEWQPPALDAGDYFWRVSARSASGLDGFASVASLKVRRAIADVTLTSDTGEGSLRQAILNANASTSAMEIRISTSGTIKLTEPLPRITAPVTIVGTSTEVPIGSTSTVGLAQTTLQNPTRSNVTIDFGGAAIGFNAADALTLRNLTIVNASTAIQSAASLTLDNVMIGTLLARTDSTGIDASGATNLRRVLITGMLRSAILMRDRGTLDAEFVEISNSGDGLNVARPGSRIRHSLFLLNEIGAAVPENSAVESSTFRGNRTARIYASSHFSDSENVYEDNLLTAVIGGRVTKISVNADGATVVTGNGMPGATIEIYSTDTLPARTAADGTGAFEVTLEKAR